MFAQIKFVLSILPILVSTVREIEALFPEGGEGQQKLVLVKNILTETDETISENWNLIEKLIGYVVGFFNSTGKFEKQ
jgi:hypothetical protein